MKHVTGESFVSLGLMVYLGTGDRNELGSRLLDLYPFGDNSPKIKRDLIRILLTLHTDGGTT